MTGDIDDIDRSIISELLKDANISHADLSIKCGITRQTVASRIKKLQKNGAIKNYKAVVDYEKLGLHSFFILFLKLDVSDPTRAAKFIDSIKTDPNVIMDVPPSQANGTSCCYWLLAMLKNMKATRAS